ncbi:MAG: prolipoprotein diacylglyceryl transferase [Candidatus Loosdrechtia sp.]|uniref:prolipoprotein diacylglyceryl transferase n=1 Tax=Candidatus Loosdrechtia sp. TaxID=3101272 RepID=UPI003A607C4E|nr:MAG: prolipoprotein diacylglyceryl transferase [Candidatus Jettenia sp. AMX2]
MRFLSRHQFNNYLDKLARPEVRVLRRSLSSYQVCGVTGLFLAILLVMTLVINLGLSLLIMSVIVLTAVFILLGMAMITKIITGNEKLIYYHHQIVVIVATIVLLRLLHCFILPYLDITILGVGVFLFCGRIGCFMVGCCHGRPHRWGTCYHEKHAFTGFPPYFVGVRLFPVQILESILIFLIISVSTILVFRGYASGEAFVWHVIAYGIGRFFFEFIRGDPGRPYLWGFSEAQWTSLILMSIVVSLEFRGALPFHLWHVVVTAGMIPAMLFVFIIRQLSKIPKYQLLHPRHMREVSEAIEPVSGPAFKKTIVFKQDSPFPIIVGHTSLGIQISTSKIQGKEREIDHYAFSSKNETMSKEAALTLANLIVQLKHPYQLKEFITGKNGIFHLLIHS